VILFVAKVAALYAAGPIAKDSSRQSAHLRATSLLFQTERLTEEDLRSRAPGQIRLARIFRERLVDGAEGVELFKGGRF